MPSMKEGRANQGIARRRYRALRKMDCDKEEYQCSVSLCTAFDPVNINPAPFLYDRNTVERLLETNPRILPTIPQTRQPFRRTAITPNFTLRAEMRQYFTQMMGTQYTGWEVIPDYPHLLSLPAIGEFLDQIDQCFPNGEENLHEMSEESWSKAWKRLNYLRLNLQLDRRNRQLFLSDENSIKTLGQIICRSYSRDVKTEEAALFHRESLRTIRVLDMSTVQLRNQLRPQNILQRSRFIQFLLRNLQSSDESFHSLVIQILSIGSSLLEPEQVSCVVEYLMMANPNALSSTHLKNILNILHSFYVANFFSGNSQMLLDMIRPLVTGLVQIFMHLLGIFRSGYRMGNAREDAVEALRLVLFLIDQILNGAQLIREPALAWSTDLNLLKYVQEMIRIEVDEDQGPVFAGISEDHWLFLINIANRLYEDAGTVDTLTAEDYERYMVLLLRNSSLESRHSDKVRPSLEKMSQMFQLFVRR